MAKERNGDNLSPPSSPKMDGLTKPDEVAISVTYSYDHTRLLCSTACEV